MPIPLTIDEAIKKGLRRLSPDEVAALDRSAGHTFTHIEGYLCYNSACSGGTRTVCYNNGDGCNECFETSEGC